MKNKKIITICASASFYREVIEVKKQLMKYGFKVIIPKIANIMKRSGDFNVLHYKTWFKNEDDYKIKRMLIDDNFKKIITSDAILVVNEEKKGIKGYIGGNVLMEMTIAYHYKKPIFILHSVDNTSPFEEEIKALNSIFIDADLSRIKVK